MGTEARQGGLVKPIAMVMTCDRNALPRVTDDLTQHFGKCDFRGQWHPFNHSSYYEAEMGNNLWRCVISFEDLVPGWTVTDFKRWTNEVEDRHRVNGCRRVNCDPGYVDHMKMVLTSGKQGGFRVLVAPGVWVDVLLWYNKGWQAFPWTFPDFRDGTYFEDLTRIRRRFKAQVADRAFGG